MNREPLITRAAITVVTALLAVAAAFGLDLTEAQENSVVGAVAVLAPLVVALWSRGKVTPTADPHAPDGTPLVREAPVSRIEEVPYRAKVNPPYDLGKRGD